MSTDDGRSIALEVFRTIRAVFLVLAAGAVGAADSALWDAVAEPLDLEKATSSLSDLNRHDLFDSL